MAKRGGSPEMISERVEAVADRFGLSGMIRRSVIWKKWREIVGESVAAMAWPKTFRNRDVLVVAVADSAWMHHLSYFKLDILKRLNRLLDDAPLSDIRFVIDDIASVKKETVPDNVAEKKSGNIDALPSELHERAERLAGQIDDPDLRKLLYKLYLNNAARHLANSDDF